LADAILHDASPVVWQATVGMKKEKPITVGLLECVMGSCGELSSSARGMFGDEVASSYSSDELAAIAAATIDNCDLYGLLPALEIGEEKRKTSGFIQAWNDHAEGGSVSVHPCHGLRSERKSMSFFMLS
jgi:hypothetical protein